MEIRDTEELKAIIKQKLIIERLKLEDITADEIEDHMQLFEEGLGLDSVEAFEMIVGMEQIFGVKVEDVPVEELKEHMYSVHNLAQFLEAELNKIES